MNLWLRLLWCILIQPFTPKLEVPDGVSRLKFRVMPHDLDAIGHMNNGRYLTIGDLGRLDLVLASGLWRAVVKNRWTPIASSIAIRFRREMRLFEPFQLETRVLGWDDTIVVIEHQFVFVKGERAGQVASRALFKGGFYDRKVRAFVPITEVMTAMGYSGPSPKLPTDVEAFLKADDAMRQAA
jgi:acyl-CoA thioesterase FadM